MKERKKIVIWAVVLLAAAGAAAAFWPQLVTLWHAAQAVLSEENIEACLRGHNYLIGLVLLAALQAVQVVSVVIPCAPIQIAGGLVYGTPVAFVVCHLAFVGTNLAVFRLAGSPKTFIGRRAARRNANTDRVTEWIRGNEPAVMTLLAYMMPGLPNGLIPYAAARAGLSLRQLFLAVYGGSLLPILLMCLLGSKILSGDVLAPVLMCGFLVVCIAILYGFKAQLMAVYHLFLEKTRK